MQEIDCCDGGYIFFSESADAQKLYELIMSVEFLEKTGYRHEGQGPFPSLNYYGAPTVLQEIIKENNFSVNYILFQMGEGIYIENGKKIFIDKEHIQIPKYFVGDNITEEFERITKKYKEFGDLKDALREGKIKENLANCFSKDEKEICDKVLRFYKMTSGNGYTNEMEAALDYYDVIMVSNANK